MNNLSFPRLRPGRLLFTVLLTVFVISSAPVFSQDLIDIYGKYLPQDFISRLSDQKQISLLLESKSRIHPDLIYYYIEYYNALSSGKSSSDPARPEHSVIKDYINFLETGLLSRRNKWIENQLSRVESMEMDSEVKVAVKEAFSRVKSDPSRVPQFAKPEGIDENRLHYYSLLFFNRGQFAAYSPETDYKAARESAESNYCRNIILKSGEALGKKDNPDEAVSQIIDTWYLYDAPVETGNNISFDPASTIAGIIQNKFSVKHQPSFSVGLGYSPYNFAVNLKKDILIRGYGKNVRFEIKHPLQQIALSLGYKHYLKESMTPFSYIDVQLMFYYCYLTKPVNTTPKMLGKITAYGAELNFQGFEIDPVYQHTSQLRVTTPVYSFLNTFKAEVGIIAGLNQMKYTMKYKYNYIRDGYHYATISNPAPGEKPKEETESKFIYSPELSITAVPMNRITSCLSLNMYSLSLLFKYEF